MTSGIERGLTVRAFAKLNLALEVIGPRDDGYTEIATVFQTIELHDEVELLLGGAPPGEVRLTTLGPEPCPPAENLAFRAASLWRERAGEPRGVALRLLKRIPAGGGLGGGSADAAAVLWGLERLVPERALGPASLARAAAALGADVPYLLEGGLALGTGRGDVIERLPDLAPLAVVVAWPGFGLSTAEVYRRAHAGLTARGPASKMRRFLSQLRPLANDIPAPFNDLYPAAVDIAPPVGRLVEELSGLGGAGGMTGSGSSAFGVFPDDGAARDAAGRLAEREPGAWVRCTRTLARQELAARRTGGDGEGRIAGS